MTNDTTEKDFFASWFYIMLVMVFVILTIIAIVGGYLKEEKNRPFYEKCTQENGKVAVIEGYTYCVKTLFKRD